MDIGKKKGMSRGLELSFVLTRKSRLEQNGLDRKQGAPQIMRASGRVFHPLQTRDGNPLWAQEARMICVGAGSP